MLKHQEGITENDIKTVMKPDVANVESVLLLLLLYKISIAHKFKQSSSQRHVLYKCYLCVLG